MGIGENPHTVKHLQEQLSAARSEVERLREALERIRNAEPYPAGIALKALQDSPSRAEGEGKI